MRRTRLLPHLCAVAGLVLLTACGDKNPVAPPPPPPPTPATQTIVLSLTAPAAEADAAWQLVRLRGSAPWPSVRPTLSETGLTIVTEGADLLVFSDRPLRDLTLTFTVPTAQAATVPTGGELVERVSATGQLQSVVGWTIQRR